jgi:hypothetical protein
MQARFSAVLSLHTSDDGAIVARITPALENDRFVVDDVTLAFTVWSESPDVVRASISHPASATTTYFQTTGAGLAGVLAAIQFALIPRYPSR